MHAQPGSDYTPAMFERDAAADGVTSKALAKAMRLLKENRIRIENFGPLSRECRKLALGPAPTKTMEGSTGDRDA